MLSFNDLLEAINITTNGALIAAHISDLERLKVKTVNLSIDSLQPEKFAKITRRDVFDQVWEVMLEKFKMGENSAKTTNMSTMVVETYTTYNNEVKEGVVVEINLTFFDHDKKRLHFKMEMIEKSSQKLSATLEMLSLYIDLNKRKVSEFENEKLKVMDNFINLNKSNFNNDNLVITGKLKK